MMLKDSNLFWKNCFAAWHSADWSRHILHTAAAVAGIVGPTGVDLELVAVVDLNSSAAN